MGQLVSQVGEMSYVMICPDRSIIFASTNYVRTLINKTGLKSGKSPVVLDCQHVSSADFTAAKGFAVSAKSGHRFDSNPVTTTYTFKKVKENIKIIPN